MARRRTLRLLFSYVDANVDALSVEHLEMTPPPSDPLEEPQDASGFWYELRDGQGHMLYRRIACHPLTTSFEVLTGNPDQPLGRVQFGRLAGKFLLLAPDLPKATTLVLVGSAPDTTGPAHELARFDLRQFQRGAS